MSIFFFKPKTRNHVETKYLIFRRIEKIEQYTSEVFENIYYGTHVILDIQANFASGLAQVNDEHCKYDSKDFWLSKYTVLSQSRAWLVNKNSSYKEKTLWIRGLLGSAECRQLFWATFWAQFDIKIGRQEAVTHLVPHNLDKWSPKIWSPWTNVH